MATRFRKHADGNTGIYDGQECRGEIFHNPNIPAWQFSDGSGYVQDFMFETDARFHAAHTLGMFDEAHALESRISFSRIAAGSYAVIRAESDSYGRVGTIQRGERLRAVYSDYPSATRSEWGLTDDACGYRVDVDDTLDKIKDSARRYFTRHGACLDCLQTVGTMFAERCDTCLNALADPPVTCLSCQTPAPLSAGEIAAGILWQCPDCVAREDADTGRYLAIACPRWIRTSTDADETLYRGDDMQTACSAAKTAFETLPCEGVFVQNTVTGETVYSRHRLLCDCGAPATDPDLATCERCARTLILSAALESFEGAYGLDAVTAIVRDVLNVEVEACCAGCGNAESRCYCCPDCTADNGGTKTVCTVTPGRPNGDFRDAAGNLLPSAPAYATPPHTVDCGGYDVDFDTWKCAACGAATNRPSGYCADCRRFEASKSPEDSTENPSLWEVNTRVAGCDPNAGYAPANVDDCQNVAVYDGGDIDFGFSAIAPAFTETESRAASYATMLALDGMAFGTAPSAHLQLPAFAASSPRYALRVLLYQSYAHYGVIVDTQDGSIRANACDKAHAAQLLSSLNYWSNRERENAYRANA